MSGTKNGSSPSRARAAASARQQRDFVLERAAVLGPDHFHGLLRQPLPFLELAGVKFHPAMPLISSILCSSSAKPDGAAQP
jgi:hypothetical protein